MSIRYLHIAFEGALDRALQRHPSGGYVVAAATSTAGALGLVDAATRIISLVAAVLGVILAMYTIRIQRRRLRKLEETFERYDE